MMFHIMAMLTYAFQIIPIQCNVWIMYILWCDISLVVTYLSNTATTLTHVMLCLHVPSSALYPCCTGVERSSIHHLSLPSAVSAANRLSIVRFSRTLSCPCGSNQSDNKNLAVVCASSLLGSSTQDLPVVTSR